MLRQGPLRQPIQDCAAWSGLKGREQGHVRRAVADFDGSEPGPAPEAVHGGPAAAIRAVLAVVAVIAITVAPLIGLGLWGVRAVDAAATRTERILIERTIGDRLARSVQTQESVTLRDEAAERTRARDMAWIEDNLSVWMYEFYGTDAVILLDEHNVPFHAMRDGSIVDAAGVDMSELRAFADATRAALAGPARPAAVFVQGLTRVSGLPAVVTVRPIAMESDGAPLPAAAHYLHVQVNVIGEAFLAKLSARSLVRNLRLVEPQASQAGERIDLVSRNGAPLGTLVWDAARPGSALLAKIAPGLTVTLMLLGGFAGAMMWRLIRSIRDLAASETRTRHLAFHDVLTGLPNRAMFERRLQRALLECKLEDGRMALHLIDLDRFKNVNDTLGHQAGDALIRQVAARLGRLVRDTDTVARLGGDEFAIIQPGVKGAEDARRLAERILVAIRAPFALGADEAFVDSSIGTVVSPDFGVDGVDLMRKADIALYGAKAAGKGRQCVFEAAQDEVVRRKRRIETDLRDQLAGEAGFELAFQPVFAIDGTRITGAEALVRWTHPELGALSPIEFIPVAEERGLGPALGAWVMRAACEAARALDLSQISVNVSPTQFRDPGFVDMVLDLLMDLEMSPQRLQIEITEGLLTNASDPVARALTKLRFAGISVALDDFGTGASSLTYLHRFRVDRIKIHQSFVSNLGARESTDAIVRAMIDLARALDLAVTAEGVETEAQWRALAGMGAPEVQGYHFGRPLAREAFAALLAAPAGGRAVSG